MSTRELAEELKSLLARKSDVETNGPTSEKGQEWLASVTGLLSQIDTGLSRQFDLWARAIQLNLSSYTAGPIWNQMILMIRTTIAQLEKGTNVSQVQLDELTGLASRGQYSRGLIALITQARDSRTPLSLIVFDIDKFKAINDEFGHVVGDEALRIIATEIMNAVSGKGVAYRYGGEELAVILPNSSLDEAVATAERVRKAIESLVIDSIGRQVTVSAGVAEFPSDASDGEALFIKADRALYQAKSAGRNRVGAAINDKTSREGHRQANEEAFQTWIGWARSANVRGYWLSVVARFNGVPKSFGSEEKSSLIEAVVRVLNLPNDQLEISADRQHLEIGHPLSSNDKDYLVRFSKEGLASIQTVGSIAPIPAHWVLSKAYSAIKCLRDPAIGDVFSEDGEADVVVCLSNWPEEGIDPQGLLPRPVKITRANLRGHILCEPYHFSLGSDSLGPIAQFAFAILGEAGVWNFEEPLMQLANSTEDFTEYLEKDSN